MGDFQWAINQLGIGRKVRRPCWGENSYWVLGIDEKISFKDGVTAHVHLNQIKATDWEIYEEEQSLSEKRKELFRVIENLEYAEFNDIDSRIDKIEHIKGLIISQDKEFIKQVIEIIQSPIFHHEQLKRLYKLVGSEPSKNQFKEKKT